MERVGHKIPLAWFLAGHDAFPGLRDGFTCRRDNDLVALLGLQRHEARIGQKLVYSGQFS
jgi:hypothetical protein